MYPEPGAWGLMCYLEVGMKICLLGLGLVGVMLGGCGPGLSHHGQWAKAPVVDAAPADKVATTTITSAPLPEWLPSSRLPAAEWEEPEATPVVMRTWGAPPEADPNFNPEYGF
jgi:hypothetical protein